MSSTAASAYLTPRQQLLARPLNHQKVPARKTQSAPTCPATPWQSPGTSSEPSLMALQGASFIPTPPCGGSWGPERQRVTQLPCQCAAGLRLPPGSDSSPRFNLWTRASHPPQLSLCLWVWHLNVPCTMQSVWTLSTNLVLGQKEDMVSRGCVGPGKASQWSLDSRRPRAQKPPTVPVGEGECWGVLGQSGTAHCPSAMGP